MEVGILSKGGGKFSVTLKAGGVAFKKTLETPKLISFLIQLSDEGWKVSSGLNLTTRYLVGEAIKEGLLEELLEAALEKRVAQGLTLAVYAARAAKGYLATGEVNARWSENSLAAVNMAAVEEALLRLRERKSLKSG